MTERPTALVWPTSSSRVLAPAAPWSRANPSRSGSKDFADFVRAWPKDFDVLFFAGIREGALILKEMRAQGLDAIVHLRRRLLGHQGLHPGRRRRRHQGGRCSHSVRRARIGTVPGSSEFGARYTAKYGPINNYAASSYDSARVLMAAIAEAATAKEGRAFRPAPMSWRRCAG